MVGGRRSTAVLAPTLGALVISVALLAVGWLLVGAVERTAPPQDAPAGGVAPAEEQPLAGTRGDGGPASAHDPRAGFESAAAVPAIDGPALPGDRGGQPDPAVGLPAPRIVGADVHGEVVTLGAAGAGPTLVVVLAHWCPVCQGAVADLVAWERAGLLPDDLTLIGVLSVEAPGRGNWPGSAWLDEAGWPGEVIIDGPDHEVLRALGVRSLPGVVLLDANGVVQARTRGPLTHATLEAILDGSA